MKKKFIKKNSKENFSKNNPSIIAKHLKQHKMSTARHEMHHRNATTPPTIISHASTTIPIIIGQEDVLNKQKPKDVVM
ncbi:hypothetical protein GQX74_010449 [Glossina fuscipes]|nr:hypothetical protein GQX74_010449 [Glossina fuscipes]